MAPQPKISPAPLRAGLDGIIDSLLAAQHVMEMVRRSLLNREQRTRLKRLVNRLTKILSEIREQGNRPTVDAPEPASEHEDHEHGLEWGFRRYGSSREMAENGLLDPGIASAIERTKGVKREGVRAGNWLVKEQANDLLTRRIPLRSKASATAPSSRF